MNIDWHLNKSVSLSVIVLLALNLSISIWWLAGLNRDVEMLKARPDLVERVIRLETKFESQEKIISKIDRTLIKIDNTISEVSKELARRKPLADAVEKELMEHKRDTRLR